MSTYLMIWIGLAGVVLVLAALRKFAARREDDVLHLRDAELNAIAGQQSVALSLGRFDWWGKTLTILTVVYGLGLFAVYIYDGWEQSLHL